MISSTKFTFLRFREQNKIRTFASSGHREVLISLVHDYIVDMYRPCVRGGVT